MLKAYYNEIDPYSAEWLRNLIAAGHIAPGDVDDRSIEDVEPAELAHGAAARVGRLRSYGNAIVPQVAQAFIESFMECRPC